MVYLYGLGSVFDDTVNIYTVIKPIIETPPSGLGSFLSDLRSLEIRFYELIFFTKVS